MHSPETKMPKPIVGADLPLDLLSVCRRYLGNSAAVVNAVKTPCFVDQAQEPAKTDCPQASSITAVQIAETLLDDQPAAEPEVQETGGVIPAVRPVQCKHLYQMNVEAEPQRTNGSLKRAQ